MQLSCQRQFEVLADAIIIIIIIIIIQKSVDETVKHRILDKPVYGQRNI